MKCDRSFKRDQARHATLVRHVGLTAAIEGMGFTREEASRLAYKSITQRAMNASEHVIVADAIAELNRLDALSKAQA